MGMTSRERVEAALEHRAPDRTPVFEYVLLSPLADCFLGRRYAADPAHWEIVREEKGWEGAVCQMAIDQLELALRLGHDMLYVIPNPALTPKLAPERSSGGKPPSSVRKDGAQERGSDRQGDPVEALHFRNECERLAPPPGDDVFQVYVFLQEQMRRRGVDLPILAPAYLHGVWTDVDLMQAMLLAPEVAQAHFALATRKAIAFIDRYIELGLHQVGVGGDFSGTRPIISPRLYRKFIVPEVRKVTDRLHAAGLRAVNASDGDLWPVIDDYLIGCGVDGYLEIDLHAGMDLARLKARYGERITFYGNLDCGIELSFGTPEIVRRHTIECLEAGLGNGGHILCASNAITASVPLENYLAAVNAYRYFFNLPTFHL
jgi:hypothetical protein